MNFDEAIKAHSSWKIKLTSYINRPDHSLSATDASNAGKCALGQWLTGEGKRHTSLPEFSRLVSSHARFHKAAGDIITRADAGQKVSEEMALGGKSEYALASNEVIAALLAMKHKA